jgi:hypothetical protein
MKTMVEGELHDGGSTSFTVVFLLEGGPRALPIRKGVSTRARNIFPAGYEFEGDRAAIS